MNSPPVDSFEVSQEKVGLVVGCSSFEDRLNSVQNMISRRSKKGVSQLLNDLPKPDSHGLMLFMHRLHFSFFFFFFLGKAYQSDKAHLNLTENTADMKHFCTVTSS